MRIENYRSFVLRNLKNLLPSSTELRNNFWWERSKKINFLMEEFHSICGEKSKKLIISNNGWMKAKHKSTFLYIFTSFYISSNVSTSLVFSQLQKLKWNFYFIPSFTHLLTLQSSSSSTTLQFHCKIYGSITFLTRRVKFHF